jgi:hypothetical protein
VARERFHHACSDRFRVVPAGAARLFSGLVETIAPKGSLTTGLALSGSVVHRFRCRKAREELGYAPRVALEDAIGSCIEFTLKLTKGRIA